MLYYALLWVPFHASLAIAQAHQTPIMFLEPITRIQCISARESVKQIRPKTNIDLEADNISGAAIFVGYIIAALFITYQILVSLDQSYQRMSPTSKLAIGFRYRLYTFSGIALISFATLSYNMLAFLISSFLAFREAKDMSTSYNLEDSGWIRDILHWTQSSTLFADFATELVSSSKGFFWSQYALVTTLMAMLYMSTLGRQHNIPKLLLYFVISQILPISFALSLLFIAVLLNQGPRLPLEFAPSLLSPVLKYAANHVGPPLITFAYQAFTSDIPCALSSEQLISYVLATRFMLAMTYHFTFALGPLKLIFLSWIFGFFAQKVGIDGSFEIFEFLFQEGKSVGYAVRTLGFDAIILAISFLVWLALTEVPERPAEDENGARTVRNANTAEHED